MSSHFGQGQPSFDDRAGQGGRGGSGGVGGSVPVSLHAGSYRVPAEAFLGPPERATATWVGFQSVWSGLPYVAAFPVESSHRPTSGTAAAGADGAVALRTANGVRLSMLPASCRSGGGRGSDARAAAAVACPFGNTDYAVSTAWAFEAWDGTPVLCALTAMKAPFSSLSPRGGAAAGGERGDKPSWHGRLEVRCGSLACSEFAQCNPARLSRFVTNGVFSPPVPARQPQQQQDSFGGAFLPATAATQAPGGAGGGLNGSHPDWFSRTDTAPLPSPSPGQGGVGVVQTATGNVKPLVRALWEGRRVDTVAQPATAAVSRVGASGTVEASA